jgi:hypothetical protein
MECDVIYYVMDFLQSHHDLKLEMEKNVTFNII